MTVCKVWCEWDLGFPEIFDTEHTAREYYNNIDFSEYGLDTKDYNTLEDEGLLGFEYCNVIVSEDLL